MENKSSIMVVDDELVVRESLSHWFKRDGYDVDTAASGAEALEKLEKYSYDTLFVDMKMPGMNGFELMETVKKRYPDTAVIIITAYGSIATAVNAMRIGATDYLLKPFKPEQLSLVMEKINQQKRIDSEYRYLKVQMDQMTRFDNIIGESAEMKQIYSMITEVAETDASILILGETGTGKELVAKAIHAKSRRCNYPFIPINCGALPDSLLESELFGYRKGAFTGANQSRKGFLEVVAGGTLFLDEIGDISSRMQVDLLRVLEDKKITKLGGTDSIDVDFRLISATRQDLQGRVNEGRFRNDFFFRINVIKIQVPPLRKRKDDIPLLVDHFLKKYSQVTTRRVDHVSPEAMAGLLDYDWPGNVRELENAVERAVVLAKARSLNLDDFSFLKHHPSCIPAQAPRTLRDMERFHIGSILDETGWNITQAAKILDVSRTTLHRMINRFGLEKS